MNEDQGRPVLRPLTRRRFLYLSSGTIATVAAGGVLAACGASPVASTAAPSAPSGGPTITPTPTPTPTTAPAAGPKRGGRLRVALSGGGNAETLNPNITNTEMDDARNYALFEGLTKWDGDGTLLFNLAEEMIPNADATVWTARLRPGVVFHNGKTMTADDVVYSFKYILDEASGSWGRSAIVYVDPNRIRKIDDMTVEFGLNIANAFFPWSLGEQRVRVVPEGTTSFDTPVGTGPFKFESFTPGERSLFVRHGDYREHGGSYLDELEYLSISDPTARLNALLSGQADAIGYVDAAQVATIEADPNLVVNRAKGMTHVPLCMQTDAEPFNDVRVRQAFRLLVDRQQMIDNALSGLGHLGNDLESWGDPYYAMDLPQRGQDLDKAKALLKAAGKEGLTVTYHTSDISTGMLEASALFAEQAKKIGVTVELKKYPADQFWSTAWMTNPFFATEWAGRPLVPQIFIALAPDAAFPETNWKNEAWSKAVSGALASTNEATQKELLVESQRILWEEGGYIVWGFRSIPDGVAKKVQGLKPSIYRPLGGHYYNDVWLDT